MTRPRVSLDVSNMIAITGFELRKLIDEYLARTGDNKRNLATKAKVPYSWIVDLYRNETQKIDAIRAKKILDYIGAGEIAEEEPIVNAWLLFQTKALVARMAQIRGVKMPPEKEAQCEALVYNKLAKYNYSEKQPIPAEAAEIVDMILEKISA